MSESTPSFRYFEDVEVGAVLPRLEFPITVKTMVLAVCGTRDLMPYHHDPAYSKSVGNRDMFVNTMFDQALFGRFVTDWSGPESDFRETSLQMVGSLCPGDLAMVEGRVTEKRESGGDRLVKIEMGVSSPDHGLAATSTATIAMPSRAAGPVRPVTTLGKPVVTPHPEMPDFAKEWLGKVGPRSYGAYPISEVQIMYWCDMVEDDNALYVDGDYARKSRHGGVVAPPMGLITWSMQRAGRSGVDPSAPDCNAPNRKPWPPAAVPARGARDDRPGLDAAVRKAPPAGRSRLLDDRGRELLAAQADAPRPRLLPDEPRHLLQPARRDRRLEPVCAPALRDGEIGEAEGARRAAQSGRCQ
jgi:acyl dehydratase